MTQTRHPELNDSEPAGYSVHWKPITPAAPAAVHPLAVPLLLVSAAALAMITFWVATGATRAQITEQRTRADQAEQRATAAEQEVNRVKTCISGGA